MVFSGHVEEQSYIHNNIKNSVSSELYLAKQETGSGAMLS